MEKGVLMRNGLFTAFVPFPLAIKERPELDLFPANVLFAKIKTEDGKTILGTALYEPDLESYKKLLDDRCTLEYRNIYSDACRLVIEYVPETKEYTGTKFVRGEWASEASENEWDKFFIFLTSLGLTNGERCKFEVVNEGTRKEKDV